MTANSHTRRTVLAASAASVGALALAACGEDSGGTDGNGGGEQPAAEDPGGVVAALSDVPVGEATAATTPGGQDAMVFRPDETTVVAFSAICTHAGCTVQPDGEELHCPCHNSVFDAATGEVLDGPAPTALPAIPVKIDADRIVTE
ncbi:ubiquinol-cytochrome c reductase iron-sulfur subunit [Streptomyces hoynatensis]|uniref:Cytochrome bc1 complex Rieske iron-sulfur subunit n=1 Tax=Streptomyces hoynatensis TaxID=1141874 RepID=A0A3A9YPI3_9ACTN|nr:Rieske (2Fe-2S) protein [Streptomyces hoynatensis]RKN37978.1 Rieske (2Fe-2S) protein [Streptomyces hoynatensis]